MTHVPESVRDRTTWALLQELDEHGENLTSWERRAMHRLLPRLRLTDSGCIETGMATGGHGYVAVYATNGGSVLAHRLVYRCLRAPIPHGKQIDHICRNRRCVNPDHLEVVDQAENKRRAAQAKTACPMGHPYDLANTYRSPRGERRCRECHRRESRERSARRRKLDEIREDRLP